MTWENASSQFIQALSSPQPTPGGGAAAAHAGAMGCALACMAIATTLGKKNTPAAHKPALEQAHRRLLELQHQLTSLTAQDAQAYGAYLSAVKLPATDLSRPQAVQEALWQAAHVPCQTATACLQAITQVTAVQPAIAPVILSDAHCAAHLLACAVACCRENILANLPYIKDPQRQDQLKQQLGRLSL